MEPRRVHGDGDAPVHRVPAPHGAVLRRHAGRRSPHVGGAAAVDRQSALLGGRRCPVPPADPVPRHAPSGCGVARHGDHRRCRCRGGGPGLHVVPLCVAERGAPVRPAAAVGRAAVDDRVDGAGAAPRRMAPLRPLRHRGGAGGQHQRRGVDPRGRGSGAVGAVGARRRSRAVAPGAFDRGEGRRAQCRGVAVVGGRARRRGRLRHGHLALHRVDPDRGPHQPGVRDPAGARLLVLLRSGQAGPVPAHGRTLHDVAVAPGSELRRPGGRLSGRLRAALARAGLLHRPGGGGHHPFGRRPPVGEPVTAGEPGEVGRHGLDGRPGSAQHQSGNPAGRAGHGGAPRRRRRRADATVENGGIDRGAVRRRTGGSRPPLAVDGAVRGRQPVTAGADPVVLGPGGEVPRHPSRCRPDPRAPRAGDRLLHLPVGHHARAGAARPHDAPRGRSWARPLRLPGVGEPARDVRRRRPGRHVQPRRRGTAAAHHERR